MNIDHTFKLRGQRYVCVGHREYETHDGRWLNMLVLETDCPDCGIDFRLLATQTNARRRQLTRRCEDCRRPGVPVDRHWQRKAAKAKPAPGRKLRRCLRRQRKPSAVRAIAPVIRVQRAPERRSDVPPSNVALLSVAAPVVAPAHCPMPSTADIAAGEAVIETYMRALGML
jgi:hypothetical protein